MVLPSNGFPVNVKLFWFKIDDGISKLLGAGIPFPLSSLYFPFIDAYIFDGFILISYLLAPGLPSII